MGGISNFNNSDFGDLRYNIEIEFYDSWNNFHKIGFDESVKKVLEDYLDDNYQLGLMMALVCLGT
jgi:hypothetical protein